MDEYLNKETTITTKLTDYLDVKTEPNVKVVDVDSKLLLTNLSKAVSLYDIYRVIAGHSYYHGDRILSALTCIAEGKEVNPVSPADVTPVVHGRWIRPHWKNNNYCCDCSKCGGEAMHRDYQWNKNGVYPICPNCGAKMDGGDDNACL